MTPQEAKEIIKVLNEIRSKNLPCETPITEALNMAVEALEKQISKKPIWDMGWVCPNCKHEEILHFPKRPDWNDLFCKHCGQALDWSDTE
jgi:hypothetical protein